MVHDGKKLAKFINKNYQNLEKWWLDNKTQNSMKYFANEFAYYSSESEKDFQKFLLVQNLATLILQNDND